MADVLQTLMCRNKKSRQEVALSPFRWMIKYFGWNGNPSLCIHATTGHIDKAPQDSVQIPYKAHDVMCACT